MDAVELVAELIKHGADVNVEALIPKSTYKEQNRCTPLHSAAQKGQMSLAILDLLLSVPSIKVDATNYKGTKCFLY